MVKSGGEKKAPTQPHHRGRKKEKKGTASCAVPKQQGEKRENKGRKKKLFRHKKKGERLTEKRTSIQHKPQLRKENQRPMKEKTLQPGPKKDDHHTRWSLESMCLSIIVTRDGRGDLGRCPMSRKWGGKVSRRMAKGENVGP